MDENDIPSRTDTPVVISNYVDPGSYTDLALAGVLLFIPIVLLAWATIYALISVTYMVFFKKVGIASWKAWVPVYSTWIWLERAKVRGAWSLLMLVAWIPIIGPFALIAGITFAAIASYNYVKAFNKDTRGVLVGLFVFSQPIWMLVMGLDKDNLVESKLPKKYTV